MGGKEPKDVGAGKKRSAASIHRAPTKGKRTKLTKPSTHPQTASSTAWLVIHSSCELVQESSGTFHPFQHFCWPPGRGQGSRLVMLSCPSPCSLASGFSRRQRLGRVPDPWIE